MKRFLLAVLLALPASAQTLVGRALLPADTFASGPQSGQWIEAANGRTPPFPGQPIGGFSSLARAGNGDFWALCDNGFGTKANSPDFLLRLYRLGRDLQTERGGSGTLVAKTFVPLRDPKHKAPFRLVADRETLTLPDGKIVAVPRSVREERLLTGADFDPESLVAARDGTFWVGDEFGPFLLHFGSDGTLLDAPFALAGVASPDDPLGRKPTIARSKGFEGLADAGDGRVLALLEGAVESERDPRRLMVCEFDTRTKKWTGRRFFYRLEEAEAAPKQHSIGEMTALGDGRFLVIERDSLEGEAARFKRVFAVDFRFPDAQGNARKTLFLDLLNIRDPARLSGGTTFRFPFQTTESVLALGDGRFALVNDNNYPFGAARYAGSSEVTELIVVQMSREP